MRFRLQVREEQTNRFSVAMAEQYPVDLYYLLDLSNSMSDDRMTSAKEWGVCLG